MPGERSRLTQGVEGSRPSSAPRRRRRARTSAQPSSASAAQLRQWPPGLHRSGEHIAAAAVAVLASAVYCAQLLQFLPSSWEAHRCTAGRCAAAGTARRPGGVAAFGRPLRRRHRRPRRCFHSRREDQWRSRPPTPRIWSVRRRPSLEEFAMFEILLNQLMTASRTTARSPSRFGWRVRILRARNVSAHAAEITTRCSAGLASSSCKDRTLPRAPPST